MEDAAMVGEVRVGAGGPRCLEALQPPRVVIVDRQRVVTKPARQAAVERVGRWPRVVAHPRDEAEARGLES